ncbi:hypothetical protein DJ531_10945 [Sulfolobus sp. A20-N-F6]|nr:hypothetical protein DJ531_10945 [Sulfolobus sp. A20-N-F6]
MKLERMKKGIRSKRKSLLLVSLLATLVLTSSFALLSYSLPTNILGFLPLGTTINYNIYETTSRIGTYVTFNISLNLKWNGTAFQVSGKSVVYKNSSVIVYSVNSTYDGKELYVMLGISNNQEVTILSTSPISVNEVLNEL